MSILTHSTLGTSDLARASAFYDQVLAPLGYMRLLDIDGRIAGWGVAAAQFMVGYPRNGESATASNGLTIGLAAPSRAAIDEFHRRALALGATDEGAPGERPFAPNAYAAYIRDLDGHKIAASCRQPG
ncbi:VOC family protein [Massilia yuzhufengensis]|uniref:Catechol 2,3-dioxygenase n=1 Tax=Massilia yuzhufengensis TaxID=1164594 RepID=A0A1I1J2R5_9BURK|nr:VOC family protein [Massilia yuzhufengensis]SFC42766.1 Catechol 2,3-dioxygenase [Massilia yuzhufengensis]